MTVRSRRTCLVVPASRPRMLEKALELEVDEVIVDFEDGISRSEKNDETRGLAIAAIARLEQARPRRTTSIRVNARGTEWWADDLRAATSAGPDTVILPKVESPDDVRAAAALLIGEIGLELQIETARGLAQVERIAELGRDANELRVESLVFGPGDYAASIGAPVLTIGDGPSDYALARIVVAAKANGLQAIDGPEAALDDDGELVRKARRALSYGFDGKWVIHPKQIDAVNEVFTPSSEELERARRILAAPDGAGRFDDEMIDEATRRMAESLLARAAFSYPNHSSVGGI